MWFGADNIDLRISEVYMDGDDERIEITNVSTGDFLGNIVLSWAKAVPVTLSNIAIPSHSSFIVADVWENILQTLCPLLTWASLQIDDTSWFRIVLSTLSWGILTDIDTFEWHIPQHSKASLYKTSSGAIQETQQDQIFNTYFHIRAHPCASVLLWQSTTIDRPSYADRGWLRISEIFFDWSYEWIEITNTNGTQFDWNIHLYWWGSQLSQHVTIPAYGVIVLQHGSIWYISWSVTTQNTALYQKIQDNQRIAMTLFDEYIDTWHILDTVYITQQTIQQLDGQERSLSWQWSWQELTATANTQTYNIISWNKVWNPWVVFDILWNSIYPRIPPTLPQNCSQKVQIQEIHTADVYSLDYIEILAHTSYSWYLTLSGWWIQFGSVQVNILSWQRYMITKNTYNDRQNIVHSQLEIFVWSIEIWNEDWLVDSIYLQQKNWTWQSMYFDDGQWCWRNDSHMSISTPGLASNYIDIQPRTEVIHTITQNQEVVVYVDREVCTENNVCDAWGWSSVDTGSGTTTWWGNWTWNTDSNWSWVNTLTWHNSVYFLSWLSISIKKIVYDPPWSDRNNENITLHIMTWNTGVFLSWWTLLYDQLYPKTYTFLTGYVNIWDSITITWDYGFVNSRPNCISLAWRDSIFDILCYDPEQDEWFVDNGSGSTTTGEDIQDDNIFSWEVTNISEHIKIQNLIYNPEIQWWNSESITLQLTSWDNNISLDWYRLRINDNKTTKTIQWILEPWKALTIQKNFSFPNTKATTVFLLYKEWETYIPIDSYFYDPHPNNDDDEEKDDSIDIDTVDIRIQHIVFDPPWSDTNNETITLEYIKGGKIDFGDVRVRVNNRNKKLQGILEPGETKTFVQTFWFPNNKDTCVELVLWDHVFDTLCYTVDQIEPEWDIEPSGYMAPEIRIDDIVFDPPWSDTNNETITITLYSGADTISLSDWFFLSWEWKKKYVRYWPTLDKNKTLTLTGNFWFPNKKDTCVSLMKSTHIFDTHCYVVGTTTSWELLHPTTWNIESIVTSGHNPIDISLKIMSVLPNPHWADTGKEQISIVMSWKDTLVVNNKDMYILINNKTKKYLSGMIYQTKEQSFVGAYWLPNKHACLSLFLYEVFMDTFCYEQAEDWVVYTKTNSYLSSLDNDIYDILMEARLITKGTSVCLMYGPWEIACKKQWTQKKNIYIQDTISKNYASFLEQKLRTDWQTLWYNSSLPYIWSLYTQAQALQKKGQTHIYFARQYLPVENIALQYEVRYTRWSYETIRSILEPYIWGENWAKMRQQQKEKAILLQAYQK